MLEILLEILAASVLAPCLMLDSSLFTKKKLS